MTSKNTRSVKPQQALEEYLSALLMPDSEEESVGQVAPVPSVQAAPVEAPAVAEPVLDAQQKESLQRALLTPLQRQALELNVAEAASIEPVAEAASVEPVVEVPQRENETSASSGVASTVVDAGANNLTEDGWLDNGRPYWAQDRF